MHDQMGIMHSWGSEGGREGSYIWMSCKPLLGEEK